MNGGVIDAELRPDGTRIGNIDVNTRYFVVGEQLNETTTKDLQTKFNAFDKDRFDLSIPKIQVGELLALMGWKTEDRTVELAGHRGGSAVGQQQPKKAANGKAGDAAAPATGSAAPAADPFVAPPAAAPAAAAPADPFAPAAPAAPAAADPFAPK